MVIATKAEHIAEAERILDHLRDLVNAAASKGIPMQVVPAASIELAYAQAHATLASAFDGPVDTDELHAARARVARETPTATGSQLVIPQLIPQLPPQ